MINAIARHVWLMLTFRHDGTGLPRSKYFVVLLFSLALLFQFFVFDFSFDRLAFILVLSVWVAVYYDIVIVSSWSLVTIGIGTIALPFVFLLGFGDLVLVILSTWGLMVDIYMGVRIGLLMRNS